MCKSTGQKLKELREDKDMKQKDIARLLNKKPNQIGKYEREEQQMTIPVLKKWCEILKVSADYILDLPKGLYDPR